jgi:prepilin-type N-terminal cleavage/methylation domain-containing protein/prepilin-type processing-associated H-X9-DG protein
MRKCRLGFTLVELLITIGIIAILIAILLPAVNAARSRARGAVCLSNMRQIAIAATLYETQNRGSLDPNIDDLFAPFYSKHSDIADNRLRCCPEMLLYADNYVVPLNYYGWNIWINQVNAELVYNGQSFKPQSVQDPSEVVMVADTVATNGTSYATNFNNPLYDTFGGNYNYGGLQLCRPSFHGRHGGNGAVLWLDGHASLVHPTDVPNNMPVNNNDTSSPPYSLSASPAWYHQQHIGYLTRPNPDLTSIKSEYYFFFNKSALNGPNDINRFFYWRLWPLIPYNLWSVRVPTWWH